MLIHELRLAGRLVGAFGTLQLNPEAARAREILQELALNAPEHVWALACEGWHGAYRETGLPSAVLPGFAPPGHDEPGSIAFACGCLASPLRFMPNPFLGAALDGLEEELQQMLRDQPTNGMGEPLNPLSAERFGLGGGHE